MSNFVRRTMLWPLLIAALFPLGASAQAPEGQAYTVQADDWLSTIADKFLGDVLAYDAIVTATNAKAAEDDSYLVIDNPNVLAVGQKIWIPTGEVVVVVSDNSSAAEVVTEDASPDESDSTETVAEEAASTAEASPVADDETVAALINGFTSPSETNGEVLVLYGQVLDVTGSPIPEVVVEIWQTDDNGIYDHPGDSTTSGRDPTFQFFGQTTTQADGWYAFRTILPGEYEPRPRHIHYKVKQDGTTLLTSQFYFSEDIADVQGESMFRAVGDSGNLLLLQLVAGENSVLAQGQIVLDLGLGAGDLPLTPSQAEGPFYPVVSLVDYDNDLVILP